MCLYWVRSEVCPVIKRESAQTSPIIRSTGSERVCVCVSVFDVWKGRFRLGKDIWTPPPPTLSFPYTPNPSRTLLRRLVALHVCICLSVGCLSVLYSGFVRKTPAVFCSVVEKPLSVPPPTLLYIYFFPLMIVQNYLQNAPIPVAMVQTPLL